MRTILVMSFTGTCMTVLYGIGKKILKRETTHALYYVWLKICVASYLIPLLDLKYWYMYVLQKLFQIHPVEMTHTFDGRDESYVFLNSNSIVDMSGKYRRNIIIISCWFGVMILLFLIQMINYYKGLHEFTKALEREDGDDLEHTVHLKKKMGILRKVRLYTKEGYSSFCGGLLRPYIVASRDENGRIPDGILMHELYHLKRLDIFTEWLSFIMCCVHWFNPCAYYLRKEIGREMELSCDEYALKHIKQGRADAYANLLVHQAQLAPPSLFWTQHMADSKNDKLVEERIRNAMKKNTVGKMMKLATGGLMALAVMLSSLTAFAYESVAEVKVNSTEDIADEIEVLEADVWECNVLDLTAEYIDADGNVYSVENNVEPSNLCPHTYVAVTYKTHSKNSTGGCTEKYYDAQRCTICGSIIVGTLRSTINYPICTH